MCDPEVNAASTALAKVQNPDRLAALLKTELLDSACEAAFDRLTRLASRLVHAPVTLVSLVDARRQFFKSHVGLREPWASRRETPLTHAFCKHVVDSGKPLIIEDARRETLVAGNPAIEELGILSYAGVPLTTPEGHTLGSFCAIDDHPRRWTDEEIEILHDLGLSVMTEIELRLAERAARREIAAREHAEAKLQSTLRKLENAYEREKRIATSLQECLLLLPPEGGFAGLEVEVLYEPFSDEAEVGGDFFDAYPLEGGWVVLVVGDASGKGLASAARTAEVKYALRAYLRAYKEPDLARTLARLNRFVCEARDRDGRVHDGFVSLSLAVTNPATGETLVGRAGADPPLLLRAERGRIATEALSPEGPVLGINPAGQFGVLACRLAPGDMLFLFTDGLTEARRGHGPLLGYEGVEGMVRELAGGAARPAPLKRLAEAIVGSARAFARGPLTDDVCLLLARRGGDTPDLAVHR
jgi:sigma-B regulation protein RsbU (phosphoserine phosphatase)